MEVTPSRHKKDQTNTDNRNTRHQKKDCAYSIAKFFHSLNQFFGFKLFFILAMFFSIDLQIGAYGNLPFAKVNSTFGILSLVLAALVILFYILITVVSARKLSVILDLQQNKLAR